MINNKDIEIFIIIYFNIINISNLFSYYFKFKIDIFIILLYNFNIFIKLFNKIYLYFTNPLPYHLKTHNILNIPPISLN